MTYFGPFYVFYGDGGSWVCRNYKTFWGWDHKYAVNCKPVSAGASQGTPGDAKCITEIVGGRVGGQSVNLVI